jgi:hypothetical protein
MLPGLRFLFVAIVLSLSLLIFGLGTAALLRSAHEEFSNLPNRRAQPETVFTQQPSGPATLALLRLDATVADPGDGKPAAMPDTPRVAAPPEQPSPGASAEPDRPAGLLERVAALTEPAAPAPEARADAAPVRAATVADAPVPPETEKLDRKKPEPDSETTAAAHPDPAAPTIPETTLVAPISTIVPMDDGARDAALKIATLGGPEVVIEPRAAAMKPAAASNRRVHALHRVKRRKLVRPRVLVPRQPAAFGLFDTAPQPASPPSRRNDQAGPVATDGPSGRPHSAHDPS